MCGIIFQEIKDPDCKKLVNNIKHRGPDSTRTITEDDFQLTFNRLAIVDVKNGGQPFIYGGTILAVNGEIYNHKTLETYLHLNMDTKSDCECIIKAYLKGIDICDICKMIDGDFAFVMITHDHIIIARDRVGVRPLFIVRGEDGSLLIASEGKAINNSFTIQVPPGYIFTFDRRDTLKMTCQVYFEFGLEKMNTEITSPYEILENAVRTRVESERPIGCLLSGGLDSSIIAYLLVKILGKDKVKTFSIGMKDSVDLKYAKIMADFLGTNHTEVVFTPEQGCNELENVILAIESYDITTVRASVGMYLLGKYISQNTDIKVVFSGELSDELFCGYLYFHHAPTAQDAHDESIKLLTNVHYFDTLRADRCISTHGLELRTPFTSKYVINYCTSLTGSEKWPNGSIEKRILRESFSGYIPDSIVWRRKDGFSDGVSSMEMPWYKHIQTYVKDKFGMTEGEYYCKTYYSVYKYQPIPYKWMPKWVDLDDPSGRMVEIKT